MTGIRRPHVLVAMYLGVNLGLILFTRERPGPQNVDWQVLVAVRENLGAGNYYEQATRAPFLWSPVAAWIMAAITLLGYWPWFALHLGALWLLRFSPLLVLLTATSWGFYFDLIQGNVFTFVFVAGVLGLRGSRPWSATYLLLTVLTPRPVQLPLAAVLLWRDRSLIVPFVAASALQLVIAAAIGQLIPWVEAMVSHTDAITGFNLSPSALLGSAWFLIGIPIGLWLLLRGMPGLAGLAVSPYNLPQYLLVGLWDVSRGSQERNS